MNKLANFRNVGIGSLLILIFLVFLILTWMDIISVDYIWVAFILIIGVSVIMAATTSVMLRRAVQRVENKLAHFVDTSKYKLGSRGIRGQAGEFGVFIMFYLSA